MKKAGTFVMFGTVTLCLGYLAGQSRVTVSPRADAASPVTKAVAGTALAMADRISPVKPRARDFYAPKPAVRR